MRRWKEEALLEYERECFKQKRPYQYEIAYMESEGGIPDGNPPVSALGTVIYFPDDSRNILNFAGISTEYIIFVSRDGIAEDNIVQKMLAGGMGADIIYCDEDFTCNVSVDLNDRDDRVRNLRTPWRKPDYSPDTLLSFPYIETCFAVKTAFARSVPAIKKSPEISDNIRMWDFLLRATERTNSIVHVAQILFHRDLKQLLKENNVSSNRVSDEDIYEYICLKYDRPGYQLCREAAENRRGLRELPEIVYDKKRKPQPLVSIIIPSKNQPRLLKECIANIRINAGDIPYEIIVVDNGSNEDNKRRIAEMILELPGDIGNYVYDEFEFDFSKMCNMGASKANAPYLLFLNDDVSTVSENFLEQMLVYASMPHIGAVGVKLVYPDNNLIQHIGVTDINRGPTHKLMTYSDDKIRYYGRNRYAWDVLAVTAACLMVSREKYFHVGGFSDKMKIGYNDVDLCVKLFENGYFNVVNNECKMIHQESISRGADDSFEKARRLRTERDAFYDAHQWLKNGYDPFYNPYLDMDTIAYSSFVVPEYQITDRRNKTKKLATLPANPSDKVRFNIDKTYMEWAINDEVPDAFVFEGWMLDEKKNNAFYKKYLLFIPIDSMGHRERGCIIATVSPKYRTDVKEVFPHVENIFLSGFECHIPASVLEPDKRYIVGACLHYRGGLSGYKVTLGDVYEPGRGIITDKRILQESVRDGEGEEPWSDAGIG